LKKHGKNTENQGESGIWRKWRHLSDENIFRGFRVFVTIYDCPYWPQNFGSLYRSILAECIIRR